MRYGRITRAASVHAAAPAHAVQTSSRFVVRNAVAADIPDIMRLKLELAISDGIAFTVRATAADWARDGFGPAARFSIFVAENATGVIGIAICADRYFPGWVGPTIVLLDFCVTAAFRGRGVGRALLRRVAPLAKARDSVMVELTMRAGNPAGTNLRARRLHGSQRNP